jgi:hypothetical protein
MASLVLLDEIVTVSDACVINGILAVVPEGSASGWTLITEPAEVTGIAVPERSPDSFGEFEGDDEFNSVIASLKGEDDK